MAELARGTVTDRPWGRTLGALGLRGVTGQITLAADGKRFAVAFTHGAVAGAISPLANDAAVRVALTAGLISPTQAADISRRQQMNPQRDEIDTIVEAARLPAEHASRLRRRLNAQRAARTFSPEQGEFVLTDTIQIPIAPGAELDVRSVIYLGARANLSDARLEAELGALGGWFAIKQAAIPDLIQYGFGEPEKPLIELMQVGASLHELEQANHGLDPRSVRAVVYALASCNAVDVDPSSFSSGVAAMRPAPVAAAPAARTSQPRAAVRASQPPPGYGQGAPAAGYAQPPSGASARVPVPAASAYGQPGSPSAGSFALEGEDAIDLAPPDLAPSSGRASPMSASSGASRAAGLQPMQRAQPAPAAGLQPMQRAPARPSSRMAVAAPVEAPLDLGGDELDLGPDLAPGPGSSLGHDAGTDRGSSLRPDLGGGLDLESDHGPDLGPDSLDLGPEPAHAPAASPFGQAGPRAAPRPGAPAQRISPARPQPAVRLAPHLGQQPAAPRPATTLPHPSQLGQNAPRSTSSLPHPSQLTGNRAPAPGGLPRAQPAAPSQPMPRAVIAASADPRARLPSDGLDAPTHRSARAIGIDAPTIRHPGAKAETPRLPRARVAAQSPDQILALIHARLEMIGQGADHFTLLGVQKTASPRDIESAYLALAKQLHPDKLKALGITDAAARDAQRLFAQVNSAVAVLRDPTRRANYLAILSRGGEAAVRAEEAKGAEMAMRVLDAEEAFRRGEQALRGNQLGPAIEQMRRAIELNPDEPDYHAMLAWAQFCAAPDKQVAAASTRSTLDRAIRQAPNATTARLLAGRMERMLGRDGEAQRHFQEVLRLDAHNGEALTEMRLLEQRRGRR